MENPKIKWMIQGYWDTPIFAISTLGWGTVSIGIYTKPEKPLVVFPWGNDLQDVPWGQILAMSCWPWLTVKDQRTPTELPSIIPYLLKHYVTIDMAVIYAFLVYAPSWHKNHWHLNLHGLYSRNTTWLVALNFDSDRSTGLVRWHPKITIKASCTLYRCAHKDYTQCYHLSLYDELCNVIITL